MNRHTIIIIAIILGAVVVFGCMAAEAAFANTIYMPSVSQSKRGEPTVMPCNPCAHSTPYAATATPFVGEPPMPEVQ